jgi:hypothetical protein
MQMHFANLCGRLIVGASVVAVVALVPAYAQAQPEFSFFARHDILAAVPNSTPSLAALGVADLNGDGIMDIAAADASGVVRVMLGTGNLTYTTAIYSAPGQLETIVIGDFNNDGYPDLAVGTADDGGIGVYINNGDGTFTGPATYPYGNTFGLATADVDNDGNLDIIGQGFVMLGLGNGKFEDPVPLVQISSRPAGKSRKTPQASSIIGSPVAVADFNGDGNADVIEISNVGEPTKVLLGNGNGTFRPAPHGSACNFVGVSVAIADFNNDGIPDLAFASTGQVNVCLGKGDGTFGATLVLSNGGKFPGQSIVAADLNGDGNMDIAVVDLNRGGEGTTALASPMAVFYGKGNGTFQPATVYETIFPFGIAAGDLNGDGRPDLVVAGGEETDPLIFAFLGTAGGKLESAKNFNAQVTTPHGIAVGDFTGSGKVDLAVTGSQSNTVGILLGNGNGGFQPAGTFATGPTPVGAVAGDFNGDGKLDLAIANSGLDNVSILLGNGDGTFGTATNFGAGQTPAYLVAGDFNGDGKLDLAVTNQAGNNVSILLGKGDGTFGAPTNFSTGIEPQFIAVGDLNGDGKPDLAIGDLANGGLGSVSVLLGKGDGTFQPAVTLATNSPEAAGIAIADFNGDGKPDIVVANFGAASVSVFLGNGIGAFQSAVSSPVGSGFASGPWALAAGDFNGDGKTDVAVIAFELQDVALLPGLGNGQFGPAQFFGADALPYAIASIPQGQGKPHDLVVVNEERNLVTVLKNTAH